ncbi:hypothetical protein R21_213 [Klebsiella phage R2_1]|nr:hypothetical protein R21_213 [Klebsiella phage R2_1]
MKVATLSGISDVKCRMSLNCAVSQKPWGLNFENCNGNRVRILSDKYA